MNINKSIRKGFILSKTIFPTVGTLLLITQTGCSGSNRLEMLQSGSSIRRSMISNAPGDSLDGDSNNACSGIGIPPTPEENDIIIKNNEATIEKLKILNQSSEITSKTCEELIETLQQNNENLMESNIRLKGFNQVSVCPSPSSPPPPLPLSPLWLPKEPLKFKKSSSTLSSLSLNNNGLTGNSPQEEINKELKQRFTNLRSSKTSSCSSSNLSHESSSSEEILPKNTPWSLQSKKRTINLLNQFSDTSNTSSTEEQLAQRKKQAFSPEKGAEQGNKICHGSSPTLSQFEPKSSITSPSPHLDSSSSDSSGYVSLDSNNSHSEESLLQTKMPDAEAKSSPKPNLLPKPLAVSSNNNVDTRKALKKPKVPPKPEVFIKLTR
ncbi:hypothetical protein [Cardinium endosymbiont of Nabis limbatus]|uniref:hypothetical protein n=1 Tax=Cardinium endosymbiont of Nabis limbatus TaxID=3066217 RepID=UPI003AF3A17C